MLGQVNGKIFFIESILTWFFSMYMFIEFSEDLIISWGVYIVVILNKKIKYTYHSVFFGFLYILCDIIIRKKNPTKYCWHSPHPSRFTHVLSNWISALFNKTQSRAHCICTYIYIYRCNFNFKFYSEFPKSGWWATPC